VPRCSDAPRCAGEVAGSGAAQQTGIPRYRPCVRSSLITKPLFALTIAVLASTGVIAAVAVSAEPSEGEITLEQPATWSGSVEGQGNATVCGQPASGGLPQCDQYSLTVDVDDKYWEGFEGGAQVDLVPKGAAAATANINAIAYDDEGREVARGTTTTTGAERLVIPDAGRAGSPYRIVVYNAQTGALGTAEYDASARIDSRAVAPTSGGTSDAPIPTERVSDAPCVDGMAAGVFPCDQVDLVSFLPIRALGGTQTTETGEGTVDDLINDRLNDIWGWVDPETRREYAIVGRRDGTTFVDVTDASRPSVLGFLPTFAGVQTPVVGDVWRDIKVYRDHAFIVAEERAHGMQVFDLRRLRGLSPSTTRTFSEDVHYTGGPAPNVLGNTHNLSINEETGYAYLVGSNTCNSGSHIVDIRAPQSPTFAGCVAEDGYTHDNQCVIYRGPDERFRGREICFDFNEDTVTIVDVTDKGPDAERPILARLPYDGSAYTHQGWLTEDQRYILFNDELDEQGGAPRTTTRVADVSRLDRPSLLAAYEHPTEAIDHNNYVKGSAAYQSNYRAGLRVLDTRQVAQGRLRTAGYFDVFPADDAAEFNGTWSNYPYLPSGNVIVSGIEQGLFVVRPRAAAGGADGRFPDERGDGSSQGGPTPPRTPAVPSSGDATCTAPSGFRDVGVARRGSRRLSLGFTRARRAPVTVDVFQQSVGRRVIGERLVARFTGRSAGVAWNGRANRRGRRVTDGYYFVRFRMGDDVRRVALRRVGGRFSVRPSFYRRTSCGVLRSFKLERPVFGGRTNRALGISYQLEREGSATVEVLRGSRVVRRFPARRSAARRTVRLRFDAEGRPRGDFRVRLRAQSGGRTVTATLTARRL
jgi:choice-of-anchor B domain-containing protein